MKIKTITATVGLALFAAVAHAEDRTEIVAASDVGYAPFSIIGTDGSYTGIDIDIAAALSEEMGIKIRVIDQPWSSTFPGLAAGKYDMVLAPAVINAERAEMAMFTEPYADAPFGFLVKAGSAPINGPEDLKGKRIAANKGSAFDKWISERAEEYGVEVLRFDKNSDAAQAVAVGQADAAIAFTSAAGWIAKGNPMFAVAPYQIDTGTNLGYAVNYKDEALRNKLDAAIECLKVKGVIKAAFEKWTGTPMIEGGVSMTPVAGYGAPGFKGYDATPHELNCKG